MSVIGSPAVPPSALKVLVAVLALVLLLTARGRVSHLPARSAAVVTGAAGMLALAVTDAALHGTAPAGLWDPVVAFRLQPARAQRHLEGHYVERVAFGDWHVWRRTGRDPR